MPDQLTFSQIALPKEPQLGYRYFCAKCEGTASHNTFVNLYFHLQFTRVHHFKKILEEESSIQVHLFPQHLTAC